MSLGNPERPVGGLAVPAPSGVELRPLARFDLADAVGLARQLHGLHPVEDAGSLGERFDAFLGSPDVVPFLATDGAEAIGLGVMEFRRRLNFTSFEGWISNLFVVERERGRGVGRALLNALIAEWRLRGSHRLQARVPNGATAAAGLYEAMGLHDWMLDFRLRPVMTPSVAPAAGVTIRPTESGDAEAVTALLSQFGAPRTPPPERADAVARTFAAHVADAAAGRGYSAVAEADGAVVGICAIEWQRPFWTDEVHAWLPDLMVDETHRGRGIGRSLLFDALEHARAAGAGQVSLESGPQREAAHGLYRSSGFVEPGHTWLLRRDPA
jgi:GNAT superfamily N-acetyltransferase